MRGLVKTDGQPCLNVCDGNQGMGEIQILFLVLMQKCEGWSLTNQVFRPFSPHAIENAEEALHYASCRTLEQQGREDDEGKG
jgi:hypothetical protein